MMDNMGKYKGCSFDKDCITKGFHQYNTVLLSMLDPVIRTYFTGIKVKVKIEGTLGNW